MKLLAALTVATTLAVAMPAQAQFFNSGNSGLLGLGNNLLSLGNISVLNGGILNGSNVLSGIGLGNAVSASNSSTNVTGSGHAVAPSGMIISGKSPVVIPGNGNVLGNGNTVVPGSGNVIGAGNMVGNQWGSNYSYRSYSHFGW